MEYSALCDVLIDQEMLNYVVWFTVKVRMLAAVTAIRSVIVFILVQK